MSAEKRIGLFLVTRLAAEVGRVPGGGAALPIGGKQLAEESGYSLSYVEQVLSRLRKAGIIDSGRGPRGGFRISQSPQTISIGNVIAASEGKNKAMGSKNAVDQLWEFVIEDRGIGMILGSTTVSDMLQVANNRNLLFLCAKPPL